MNFLLEGYNWVLVLLALGSGAALLWQSIARGGSGIGIAEAVRLYNREKGVLIDVSEPGEYAAVHVAGARNIPLGSLAGSKDLPTNKALPVLLLCTSGMRASRAAHALRRAGYERAAAVSGGTAAWRAAGLPVEKSA